MSRSCLIVAEQFYVNFGIGVMAVVEVKASCVGCPLLNALNEYDDVGG